MHRGTHHPPENAEPTQQSTATHATHNYAHSYTRHPQLRAQPTTNTTITNPSFRDEDFLVPINLEAAVVTVPGRTSHYRYQTIAQNAIRMALSPALRF